MQRQFDVVIERDSEGYYVASVPQLAGCHTQARSLDELMSRIREAIECHTDSDEKIELNVDQLPRFMTKTPLTALRLFLRQHRQAHITKQLNRAYKTDHSRRAPVDQEA